MAEACDRCADETDVQLVFCSTRQDDGFDATMFELFLCADCRAEFDKLIGGWSH